jgi:hypothetical protein
MRRSRFIAGAMGLGLAASVLGISPLAGPAGAATTAKSLYEAALKQAGKQNVHFVSKATEAGAVFEVIGDTGQTSGSQALVLEKGSTVEDFEVIVKGSTAYVRGNDTALAQILGLTTAQSTKYADTWLSFPTSNTTLAELIGGLRNRDLSGELQMSGPYSFGPKKTIAGHATQGIRGSAATSTGSKVPIILYVETGATPRPVEEVTSAATSSSESAAATSISGTVTYSKWGEKTHPSAPPHPVALLPLLPSG